MERVAFDDKACHLGVGHLDAGRIGVAIEFGADLEAGMRRRRADQLHDGLMADERFAAPVLGDECEQAMLDLVPFAGAGGQVADRDGNADLIDEFLQLDLPQTDACAVGAAAVGRARDRRSRGRAPAAVTPSAAIPCRRS